MFRVHSSIMRLVSSVFKDMLAVKRTDGDGPITLDESKDTLETLLDTIYPARRPTSIMSISCFRLVAIAAEKYDMISVTNTLKDFILGRNSTTILLSLTLPMVAATQYTAIEEYLITSDLGWTAVSNELSAKTLTCDLNSAIAQGSLFSGNGPAARNLFSLHRKRRILMYNSLARLTMNDSGLMGSYEEQSACKSMIYSISPSPTISIRYSADMRSTQLQSCNISCHPSVFQILVKLLTCFSLSTSFLRLESLSFLYYLLCRLVSKMVRCY